MGWRCDAASRRDRNGYLVRSEVVVVGTLADAATDPFDLCWVSGISIRFSVVLNDSSQVV